MILAVTGGKGGVGKTTVAYNLAAELDAVAVDADLSMADLPRGRGPDLHDVLAGRADPLEAVDDSGPTSLLPCGRSLAGARAANPERLAQTVRAVEREYGCVVVDSPAGLRCDAGLSLYVADACLLVTRLTRAAIADGLRARELARALETPLVRIVVNRTRPETLDSQGYRERLGATLGGPVTAIPEAPVVARAQRAGVPVRSIAPSSRPAALFADLAASLRGALA